jgi:hypothetical protein
VDPVPDPLLLIKSGSAGNRTRDLWICSQELRPRGHRGGPSGSAAWNSDHETTEAISPSPSDSKIRQTKQPMCSRRLGRNLSRTLKVQVIFLPKRRCTYGVNGTISGRMATFATTTVRTSNSKYDWTLSLSLSLTHTFVSYRCIST